MDPSDVRSWIGRTDARADQVCGWRDTSTAARLWAADVEGALAIRATTTLA